MDLVLVLWIWDSRISPAPGVAIFPPSIPAERIGQQSKDGPFQKAQTLRVSSEFFQRKSTLKSTLLSTRL